MNTQQLKERAKRIVENGGLLARDTVLALIERIEAAERERDELEDKLNYIKSTYCHVDTAKNAFIPGCLDAWGRPVPQYLPYDFSGNPGASATQYCNGWNDSGGYWLKHVGYLQQKLSDAEAELARRDAAAGEPVAWISERNLAALGKQFAVTVQHAPVMDLPIALYTAAPPAVLPPEMTIDDAPCHYGSDEAYAWVSGADSMRELFSSLGAQPQKPVVLPSPERHREPGVVVEMYESFVVYKALDAANVKWEVKK